VEEVTAVLPAVPGNLPVERLPVEEVTAGLPAVPGNLPATVLRPEVTVLRPAAVRPVTEGLRPVVSVAASRRLPVEFHRTGRQRARPEHGLPPKRGVLRGTSS